MVSTSGCAMADEVDLVGYLSPVIRVGDEEDTIAELVEWPRLKGYQVEYPTGSSRFMEFYKAKISIDGIWGHAFRYRGNFFWTCSVNHEGDYMYLLSDLAKKKKYKHLGDEVSLNGLMRNSLELNNITITKGISCKVLRKESFIDIVAREGTELEDVLKELEISRFKRVASKDDKESDKIAEGVDLRPRFEVEACLLEERCRAKAREKMVSIVDDEFKKLGLQDRSIMLEKRIFQLEGEKNQFEENLARESEAFQLELEKEREAVALKLKEVRAESVAEAEQLVTVSATSQNYLAGKLYQLRYTKAEILAFSEWNYEEKEIMDE
ncbi:hypothetical protein GIB67_017531 [Kingdonia uniflora]|uniref:Uncharacterized protein n=1 Tax=Kingdonia uniflora TaxID=39325 RepID=A0A7J7M4U6_9MAGN|nr:hypothetical protein GIB67_017531 [Kingdonia uniflora]